MDRQHEKGPDRMNTIGTFRDIIAGAMTVSGRAWRDG